jgi:hypothetical protein
VQSVGESDRAEWLPIALDFNDVDLAANRSGVLSERQRERMARLRSRGRSGTVVLAGVVLAVILVAGLLIVPRLSNTAGSGSSPAVPIALGLLGLIAVSMAWSIVRMRRALDRFTGAVLQVTGPARTRVRRIRGNVANPSGAGFGGAPRYELIIGERRFVVASTSVLEAFEDGDTYCGYYVGRGIMTRLLSAEPADS